MISAKRGMIGKGTESLSQNCDTILTNCASKKVNGQWVIKKEDKRRMGAKESDTSAISNIVLSPTSVSPPNSDLSWKGAA